MSGREWTRRGCLGAISTVGTVTIAGCGGDVPGVGTPTASGDPAVATEAATQAENWRQARIETTRRLAESETIRTGTDEQRQQYLQDERSDLPDAVYRVHYVNLDGEYSSNVVASTDPAKVGAPLNTREAPWQAMEEQTYNEEGVFVSRAAEAVERSLISFVTAVETDEEGRFVLVVQADLDVLGGDLPTPDGGFTQIVDSEGRIVATSQEVDPLERNDGTLSVYTQNPDGLSVLQDGLDGQTGVVQGSEIDENTVPDHRDFEIGFAPVEGEQWVVFAHRPVATDGFF